MKVILIIINLTSSYALFGQTKTLTNVTHANGDTSFWYKYQNILINDLSLIRLDTSAIPFYFRVWNTNQVLDIWQTNDTSYAAQLTSWVTEQNPSKEKPTDRIFIDKRMLASDTVKQIVELINTSKVKKLPSDNGIKGWKQGFDGVTYIIEFSTKDNYSFKTYWTPKAQDTTLIEAKVLQFFIDEIFDLSGSLTTWKHFEKQVPYECYNIGGTIRCKVLNKKQKRQFAKERKNYRRQMHLQ